MPRDPSGDPITPTGGEMIRPCASRALELARPTTLSTLPYTGAASAVAISASASSCWCADPPLTREHQKCQYPGAARCQLHVHRRPPLAAPVCLANLADPPSPSAAFRPGVWAHLVKGWAAAREADEDVGLHMGDDLLQVLHVGRVVCASHLHSINQLINYTSPALCWVCPRILDVVSP